MVTSHARRGCACELSGRRAVFATQAWAEWARRFKQRKDVVFRAVGAQARVRFGLFQFHLSLALVKMRACVIRHAGLLSVTFVFLVAIVRFQDLVFDGAAGASGGVLEALADFG